MIDPISRPDRFAAGAAPEPRTLDELVQARIDGRLSRRGLLRRAVALGFAAPVIGVMLHAAGDVAAAAPARQDKQPIPVTGPTKPAGEAQTGGTVTVGSNSEPDTLHPYITQLVAASDVIWGMMDGLFTYDSEQKLAPRLATAYSISDDGLTYTFTLREGVSFHNGDAFTGEDVVNSWKIIMNPDFGAFNQNGWDKIDDITVDGSTVTMRTTEVYAPFLSYVADTRICPSSAIAKGVDVFKQEFGRAPIGTGPFTFGEWRAKEQITLDKFDGYWGEPAHLDRIIYRIVPDDNTLMVQLRTGEVQACGSGAGIPPTRVDEALGFDTIDVLQHATLGWNHIDLKNVDFIRMTKVRQALDFATPSKDIIEKLLKGRALPSVADQAPGSWAFDPDIQPRPYDLEQAKQLLAEAGLTPGDGGVLQGKIPTDDPQVGDGEVKPFEIELWFVSGNTDNERIAQVVAQSWNSLGVKTTVKNQDISTIWGPEGYQFTPQMTGALFGWFNGNDPTDAYYWNSSQIPSTPTGSGGNLPAYFHHYNFQEEIDKLTTAGDATTDQEARKQIYFQIQELLHEEVPVIFIDWEVAFPGVAKNIGGFWPSAFNYLLWNAGEWYLT
ncbi:MAG: ABC transporter substrate-binding protein [Thermomicrobiales bacterium]|nr:ABC transporter substrate-binding protein [Thermomicrobiales bacterium]